MVPKYPAADYAMDHAGEFAPDEAVDFAISYTVGFAAITNGSLKRQITWQIVRQFLR